MAAKTSLNAKNLETLGASRLAALVMDVTEGDAARKRIARAALLEASGGSALAGAVSKRLVSLRRAKSRVGHRKRRAFIDDLDRQRASIATQIAAVAPKEALDLMWRFMALADPVHQRLDDSAGAMAAVFRQACADLCTIAAKAKPAPEALANQVFRAVTDANTVGEFDTLIANMAPTLGQDGLAHLRTLLLDARAKDADLAQSPVLSAAQRGLLAIADASEDVDAYIAEFPAKQRRNPIFAAHMAQRLVAANRADEALDLLDDAEPARAAGRSEWVEARLLAFEAAGRDEQAQSLRWEVFERDWDAEILRAYLKRLPDFEDDEAEDRALDLVASGDDIHAAIAFLIAWPAHHRAATLIRARREDIDGDLYYKLAPAAEALEATQPLAATLLLRSMIEYTLDWSKSPRQKHAARHLRTCEFLGNVVEAWEGVEPHDDFVARLRKTHSRKDQFWYLVTKE